MNIKRKPNVEAVEQIKGRPSRLLTSKCPDLRSVFPSTSCTNLVCEYRIRSETYLNCSFVAATAERPSGGMTLEAIAEIIDDEPMTREAIRQMEKRLLRKLRGLIDGEADEPSAVRQPRPSPGPCVVSSRPEGDERPDELHDLRAHPRRKLGQR